MRQQINLYQPTLSAERKRFSAAMAALVLLLFIGTLAVHSLRADQTARHLEDQVATLRAQQIELEAQTDASGQSAASDKPADVESRIAHLSRAVDARARALQMLQAGAAGKTTGFAARLEALARSHVEGIWLTSVKLSGSNGSMNLRGETLDADLVPRYLEGLARDGVLKGTRFDEFVIVAPSKTSRPDQSQDFVAGSDVAEESAGKFMRFRATAHELTAAAETMP